MFGAVQFLNAFISTHLLSNSFNSAKVTELPRVFERAANSALSSVIVLYVKIRLSVFPFDV